MFFLLAREGENQVAVRSIPVIFVPGIMGSRLKFQQLPRDTEQPPDWDPDNAFTMAKWIHLESPDMRDILHHLRPASLLTDGPHSGEQLARGWGTITNKFYGSMLRHLENELKVVGAEFPVYAFGYDWRQSNGDSAAVLRRFVTATLAAEAAAQVIFVTHSMGGIVVREGVRGNPMREQTLGVVHIAQPAGGAPVAYRRCFDGASFLADGLQALLLGRTGTDLFNIFTAMPSAIQLLPFDQVRSRESDWLMKRQPADGGAFVSWTQIRNMIGGYKGQHHPPSLAPEMNRPELRRGATEAARALWATTRVEGGELLTQANELYKDLDTKTHSNTWSLASAGVETDTAVCFEMGAEGLRGGVTLDLDAGRTEGGDGTVPLWSAFCLNTRTFVMFLDDGADPEFAFNFEGLGLVHDEICDDGDVQDLTALIIETITMVVMREGAIEFRGPEFLHRALKGVAGNRSAEMEIRVAKWLREVRGARVIFNENDSTKKSHDLFSDGVRLEVKLSEGNAASIERRIAEGFAQVEFDGEVIIVMGDKRSEERATYEEVKAKMRARAPNVVITFLREGELPPFSAKRPPRN